ncbi:MAG: glucuronate isomerase [Streptococcaceae bacterium]|nr:glucuronate isomerase [Streptococcaceae bacterium]
MFENENFLLKNAEAARIYERFCKGLPIVDYHCHLKSYEIYKNVKFRNITELWLSKDHYKWRLMRANGIDEARITGSASEKEKFFAWAETIERCPGNPLYHWTHMELSEFFDITLPLNSKNAPLIWEKVNQQLGNQGLGARDFISKSNVISIATTDHPLSHLEYHKKIAASDFGVQVIPTFRMDNVLRVEKTSWFDEISASYQRNFSYLEEYLLFIKERIDFFDHLGCRSTDLGMGTLDWTPIQTEPENTFSQIRKGGKVSKLEMADLKTFILIELLGYISEKDWVFQLHFGAVGSVNEESKERLGLGKGFDTVTEQGNVSAPLLFLFNQLDRRKSLPKTILYNIDGAKNVVTESVMACFQNNEEAVRGKMQHGPAWWFQDTLRGNQRQLEDLAEQGILMNFIGMTTDSRSFLSYVRHDYFRRLLCSLLGTWIEAGEMPKDDDLIQRFIEDVCYKNALNYFKLEGRK